MTRSARSPHAAGLFVHDRGIVGCLLNVLVGPENPAALLDRLSDRETAVVTLTVTEKGYHHDPASGHLNADHPEIRHDLGHPEAPRSAVGLITAASARRKAAGLPPFTVATCDNLPSNGVLLAGLVHQFALPRDDKLAAWIESTVPFPSSMVDRIVPAQARGDLSCYEGQVKSCYKGQVKYRVNGCEYSMSLCCLPAALWHPKGT
jgi:fructuronate reductase